MENESSLRNENEPWNTPWPELELESVPHCPVCASSNRALLHERLVDNVFFVANGRWNLHRCLECRSAFLDPRPNQASIGKAYGTYYTHATDTSAQSNLEQLSLLRKLRRVVSNSYLNRRFGTERRPAHRWAALLAKAVPRQRRLLDSEFRYLPKPRVGQRLLDIGCGNGAFLAKAKAAGWIASGIDLDPKAVMAAESLGLDVKVGSVATLANHSMCFDAITLSHVIEHVHEPLELIRDIFKLLAPGGTLYLETPNIDSCGSQLFQANWRGLEVPRHLVLFTHKSLYKALIAAGFENLQFMNRRHVAEGIYQQSENMQQGRRPLDNAGSRPRLALWFANYRNRVMPQTSEFITALARKPS